MTPSLNNQIRNIQQLYETKNVPKRERKENNSILEATIELLEKKEIPQYHISTIIQHGCEHYLIGRGENERIPRNTRINIYVKGINTAVKNPDEMTKIYLNTTKELTNKYKELKIC